MNRNCHDCKIELKKEMDDLMILIYELFKNVSFGNFENMKFVINDRIDKIKYNIDKM